MDFYDAHVHYLHYGTPEQTAEGFALLRERGLQGMAVIIMAHHPGDRKLCLAMIPPAYHDKFDQSLFDRPSDPENCMPDDSLGMPLFPYLDSRYMEEGVADLRPFRDAGIQGLKLLYVPEEDRENGFAGWERVFGRSVRASENLTARLVEQAADFKWPVIFHVDLRKYAPFAEDLIKAYPGIPFIVPHFGFSRKAMDGVLNRFEHVYTDFSSLLPFMKSAPEKYEGFISGNRERVLFGTDSSLGWTDLVLEYLDFAEETIKNEEVLTCLLRENYLRIHGNGT